METPTLRLSGREHQIVSLLAQGLSNKQVAHRLGLAERTVGTYLERLYERNRLHSRAEVVALWVAGQVVTDTPGASGHNRPSAVIARSTWRDTLWDAAAAILFPFLWPVATLLLWASPRWSVVTKILATAIFPGGVLLSVMLVRLPLSLSGSCGGSANTPASCSGPPMPVAVAIGAVWVLTFLGPLLPSAVLAVSWSRRWSPQSSRE